jgi:hypothetical protein
MSSTYPVSSADSPATTRSRSNRRCAAGRRASRALLRPGAPVGQVGQDRDGQRRAGGAARGVRHLVRGDGEDEGAERPPHVAVGRQGGQQREADLLGHVILVQAAGAGAGAGQPGPAVADDGGPELAQQRLDGVRVGPRIRRFQAGWRSGTACWSGGLERHAGAAVWNGMLERRSGTA